MSMHRSEGPESWSDSWWWIQHPWRIFSGVSCWIECWKDTSQSETSSFQTDDGHRIYRHLWSISKVNAGIGLKFSYSGFVVVKTLDGGVPDPVHPYLRSGLTEPEHACTLNHPWDICMDEIINEWHHQRLLSILPLFFNSPFYSRTCILFCSSVYQILDLPSPSLRLKLSLLLAIWNYHPLMYAVCFHTWDGQVDSSPRSGVTSRTRTHAWYRHFRVLTISIFEYSNLSPTTIWNLCCLKAVLLKSLFYLFNCAKECWYMT